MALSSRDLVSRSLEGKVALVTGASSGIGAATAHLLSAAGAAVGVLGPNRRDIQRACAAIRKEGGDAIPLVANVANAADIRDAVAQVKRRWKRLDIVVANAGINGLWAPVEDIEAADWDETLGVNLKGTFLTVKYAVPLLKRQGGAIVIVSSVNGTRMFSNAGASAYATSKAGQLAFGRMMALELAGFGIRVNTICPGSTKTRIFETTRKRNLARIQPTITFPKGHVPLAPGQMAEPQQVADLIWYLCSPLASRITGAEVFVDGAESLLRG